MILEPDVPRKSHTILVVDDEKQVLEVAAHALRQAGHEVLTAASGAEAERVCESHPGEIDLVVMDVILENTTGFDALPCLNRLRPLMKVLYISGYPGRLMFDNLGIHVPFLSKPFTPEELQAAVAETLWQPPAPVKAA